MEPKLPIPTDNIYKFLATFGLVLMAISMTLMVVTIRQTNDVLLQSANKLLELELTQSAISEKQKEIVQTHIDVEVENRDVTEWILALVFTIGFYSSLHGFKKWHKTIQPIYDEILELQKRKLVSEIALIEKQKKFKR